MTSNKKSNIRVLQLVDSLSVGGAERVAINLANDLSARVSLSAICATRAEGELKEFISKDVDYLFLGKKSTIDIQAISKLKHYIKSNRINLIHAHSTSYFLAFLIKTLTGVKIVWHDHFGQSEYLNKRKKQPLKFISNFFSYTFSVNQLLVDWAIRELGVKSSKVCYLSNYANIEHNNIDKISDFDNNLINIVQIANLRAAKNHFLTIEVAKELIKNDITHFHIYLIGRDFDDTYSQKIKSSIKDIEQISYLGAKTNISSYLKYADIALLSSDSEGLPIALLEYGLSNKAVVCTNVGQCKDVVQNLNYLVAPNDKEHFYKALHTLIIDKKERIRWGAEFGEFVHKRFDKNRVLESLTNIYKEVLHD